MKAQTSQDCIFCKIVNKEISAPIVYENEYVLAFLDLQPNSNGHTLVIPKKHFKDLSDTDDKYLEEVAKAKKIVANHILESDLKPKGINYVSNQGEEAYQAVFHYHEHIIPKYKKSEGYVLSKNVIESGLIPQDEILDMIKIK
ncbi:HIT family protein [Mesoplasma lactucae]|uniref:Uncharacterized protein n=1 Tax=Mesoplasma lactucae ATCC 49193 TaxID=81460 RepID=A0A291IS48_9MOLU|nr:HIT family protein [Mesoplasma lactucae]ATG97517.1 hypothetical protein CP520_01985 [Mesoplasma lactucae ATCC 49193]ATZ20027.1 histidine triad protein [Mesoplasma lactucae ATCC 49193]MCL8217022.1 Protein hit [Mesoplasma lactucae ATCC 49193]